MTGAEYASLVAIYLSKRFGERGLKVFREVRVGKSIIGKNRCIDILCVWGDAAFAVECKFQDSQGTVDEKIPYALEDLQAMPLSGCIAYAGRGFSDGVLHMLSAAPAAAGRSARARVLPSHPGPGDWHGGNARTRSLARHAFRLVGRAGREQETVVREPESTKTRDLRASQPRLAVSRDQAVRAVPA